MTTQQMTTQQPSIISIYKQMLINKLHLDTYLIYIIKDFIFDDIVSEDIKIRQYKRDIEYFKQCTLLKNKIERRYQTLYIPSQIYNGIDIKMAELKHRNDIEWSITDKILYKHWIAMNKTVEAKHEYDANKQSFIDNDFIFWREYTFKLRRYVIMFVAGAVINDWELEWIGTSNHNNSYGDSLNISLNRLGSGVSPEETRH
jgi:hypothetical protein